MGTGQGKLPLDVVTDNALRKRKYEQDELEGAQPLMGRTTSDGVIGDIEFFTRPDGTFFPAVSTAFGFSPLSGFDPFHLIGDGVPGKAFDHRSQLLSETLPAEVAANDGDAVKMVKGVRLPGGQIPKKNRISESEGWDNWTKTNAQIADTADPVAVKLTTSANAGYLQSLSFTRTIGELCVFALECKSD